MIPSLVRTLAVRLRTPPSVSGEGELLESLRLIVGLDHLLGRLATGLRELSGADTVYIVQREPITGRYTGGKACGRRASRLDSVAFLPSDRLIRWLTTNRSEFDVVRQADVLGFLTPGERDLLATSGVELVIPLTTPNRLTGIALLAGRSDGRPYEKHLINALVRVCRETSLALEQAALFRLQEDRLTRLLHADKLATVGELAAGAAHEIRNPLAFIRSSVQFMRDRVSEDVQPLVDGVIRESDRIDRILKDLLSLSRSSTLTLERVDMREVVARTVSFVEPELRARHIALEQEVPPGSGTITGDPGQLEQVILNLCMNSIQAMPEGGTLTIRLSERGEAMDDTIEIAVSDTGVGIAPEAKDRVFDPFYTTREGGTGLGLSICYGIVARHGGEILLHSATEGPARGTTVTVRLPRDAHALMHT